MKKIKILVAVLVMGLLLVKECAVAQAAEVGVTVTSRGVTVRELSQAEIAALSRELTTGVMGNGVSAPLATSGSYRVYEYSELFDITIDGTWVAQIDPVCTVWEYTDGKVHLYSRTITVTRLATYGASRTYGSIVNTDGSLSYTTGDRVHVYSLTNTWDFAIDFRVTPTEASFNCYEV